MDDRQRKIAYSEARLELAQAYQRILVNMQTGGILNAERMLVQLMYHFETTIQVESVVLKQLDRLRTCPGTPHPGHSATDWTCPIEDGNKRY